MLGLAEERGLGGEEGEVFAIVIQAAVAAAHTVAAGHGGGEHRVDSHEELLKCPAAPVRDQRGTVTA